MCGTVKDAIDNIVVDHINSSIKKITIMKTLNRNQLATNMTTSRSYIWNRRRRFSH